MRVGYTQALARPLHLILRLSFFPAATLHNAGLCQGCVWQRDQRPEPGGRRPGLGLLHCPPGLPRSATGGTRQSGLVPVHGQRCPQHGLWASFVLGGYSALRSLAWPRSATNRQPVACQTSAIIRPIGHLVPLTFTLAHTWPAPCPPCADGRPVQPPTPGSGGHAMHMSDQQVRMHTTHAPAGPAGSPPRKGTRSSPSFSLPPPPPRGPFFLSSRSSSSRTSRTFRQTRSPSSED